jgi:rhamnogalacturonan endolyase
MIERVIERNRRRLQGIDLPNHAPEVRDSSSAREAIARPRQPAQRSPTERVTRLMTVPDRIGRLMIAVLATLSAFPTGALALSTALPPATVSENGDRVVLENGELTLAFTRRGGIGRSIRYHTPAGSVELSDTRKALYFDADGGRVYPAADADARIVSRGPDAAEVAWAGAPTPRFPFSAELHVMLRRGESGFYLYAVYRRGPGLSAGGIGETRFVLRGAPGTRIFTHHVVDDRRKGPYPTAPIAAKLQDATWRLQDGHIYTKYDNSAFMADHRVHGMAGHGVGIWMIFPSTEFIGGGPFKQELTVHEDNTLLGMLVGGHFGSGGLQFRQGERWDKLYGPLFVYVDHSPTVDGMWKDAQQRAREESARWPYAWLRRPDYPRRRGVVRGRVRLADGAGARGAWAMLVPPDEDWTQVLKGYDFWSRVDSAGRFALGRVRPGRYALVLAGANQFETIRRGNVTVTTGTTDLGALQWTPVKHGRTIWQIGVADRSSAEFRGGDDARHFDNFARYPRDFPDDVTFVIGKSRERRDWNFAQWAWYRRRPYWAIQFELARPLRGRATLTIGFASVIPPRGRLSNLQVQVNGREIAVVRLPKSGMAGYRSGNQDSRYNVVYLPFGAALLRPGANEITLGHAEAQPFPPEAQQHGVPGEVMYDAIRLEVDASAAPPSRGLR